MWPSTSSALARHSAYPSPKTGPYLCALTLRRRSRSPCAVAVVGHTLDPFIRPYHVSHHKHSHSDAALMIGDGVCKKDNSSSAIVVGRPVGLGIGFSNFPLPIHFCLPTATLSAIGHSLPHFFTHFAWQATAMAQDTMSSSSLFLFFVVFWCGR